MLHCWWRARHGREERERHDGRGRWWHSLTSVLLALAAASSLRFAAGHCELDRRVRPGCQLRCHGAQRLDRCRETARLPAAGMYFPMGSTRLYAAEHDAAEPILAMARSPDGEWLATLTPSSLCVWSARQHRVVLGQYPRHPASLESDGSNVRLCWHPDSHTLAISTSGSFVYLYQVQEANVGSSGHEHSSNLSVEDCARLLHGQFHVSISLTQKVHAAVQEGAATGALAAGATHFWLGVARGVLLAIDWSVQDPTPRKLHLRPPAGQLEDSQPRASAAVTAVCCSSELSLVVGLDAHGRVGYSFGAEESSGTGATTAESLILPSESGTALAISVEQRLLCVGCASGALVLFRIAVPERSEGAIQPDAGSAAPVRDAVSLERKLSLSPWGISPEECGAVVGIDWSDDGTLSPSVPPSPPSPF